MSHRPELSRRELLRAGASCAAHLALLGVAAPRALHALFARSAGSVAAREPFGTLERVAENVWALISTPFGGDRTTLANGGIVAGRSGVLAIEGFFQPAGATWLATKARELTGRWPTHVLLTHYHADHVNGVGGYFQQPGARIHVTAATRQLALERNLPVEKERAASLADAVLLDERAELTVDLGGRSVRVRPLAGHTASDVIVELEDPPVLFAGDLVWNGIFPNYVDARPPQLSATVRSLRRASGVRYVPGHGPMAALQDLDRYIALLDEVERSARAGADAGRSPAEAAAAFRIPGGIGDWATFSPAFYERAFRAWYRELGRPT
jgi:glyoxylase-like metal-dependent hydrolase (beta-lactamase superfamily II)